MDNINVLHNDDDDDNDDLATTITRLFLRKRRAKIYAKSTSKLKYTYQKCLFALHDTKVTVMKQNHGHYISSIYCRLYIKSTIFYPRSPYQFNQVPAVDIHFS